MLLSVLAIFFAACDKEKPYKPQGVASEKKAYIVGIHPYLNSQKTYITYRPILDYLEANMPGVRFELQTSSDYADYEKKLYSKNFDFALPNPYQTLNSIQYGYRVIAKMKPDSVFRGIIVAKKTSNVKSVNDLKGHNVSFPAKTALAAAMMPLYFLQQNGLDVKKDITIKFVGSQYSSIMNAYAEDTIAAATWPPPWEQWKKEHPDMAAEMRIIWETKPLINNGFAAKESIPEETAKRVAKLLTALDQTESGRKILQNAGFDGFEYANNQRYDIVKDFLIEYDKKVGLGR